MIGTHVRILIHECLSNNFIHDKKYLKLPRDLSVKPVFVVAPYWPCVPVFPVILLARIVPFEPLDYCPMYCCC
ncbi:hypothetical protein SOVF_074740 [Spinacia oleracea]|nr:hypothetical protein SOVF_074740 [Spinacia oleracea]